ncbi:YopX family protein [Streptococcus suis]|uniref:YopX family protein n=1 Tax=Streptococcus suis TaxID=1307 RepID=UPI001CF195E5|nr:YopX family protein [Streptococcus suis]MCB2884268.1 hypothetical protein [Streptococcus suis]MCB2892316.1 hypothetical protein [Streptococcus suis]MCB2911116.1 hypothetical protein [Streptococcus suis]MCB2911138.1 hypothetical protein [Streptococcus suis]MCQ8256026.1 YopX family protein [Streptococcus suis]
MVVPKFRAWDKVSHVWRHDLYIGLDGLVKDLSRTGEEPFELPLDNAILMQSTGLFDKNGKEVWEGDVVRMHSGELLSVKLHHGMFEPVCYYISNAFEWVGNVFENSELLEHPDFREK